MSRMNFSHLDCSVARAFDEVGDCWSFLIIRDTSLAGARSFSSLQKSLNIAKNVLSNRLTRLVNAGILEKVDVGEFGSRYEYRLTEKGKALFPVLITLRQWADNWVSPEERNILSLKDKKQRKDLPYMAVRDTEGNALGPDDVIAQLPDSPQSTD